ncbi:MAG: DUF1857 family protein [Marinobacter sp.]|nr:DUF1857 family protein [Marinobacter sp.]
MEFEHIVQVNDPDNPAIARMSRQQLWQGLVLRATSPDLFVIGLEDFSLEWLGERRLKRSLALPGVRVEDEVTLHDHDVVHYEITPTPSIAGGSLTMKIEEPEPGALFVRFTYCARYLERIGDGLPYDLFVQQAYIAADIDTIRIIRNQLLS